MADYKVLETGENLSALHGLESGDGALTLSEHWPFVAQQFAWLGDMPKGLPTKVSDGAQISEAETLIPYMPGRILRIASEAGEMEGAQALDLTDGRTLLSLSGSDWRWTLMKGCALDFETMAVGDCATTTLFKVGVTLWVTGQDEVRILVSYAYARALVEKIIDAAYEVGCRLETP